MAKAIIKNKTAQRILSKRSICDHQAFFDWVNTKFFTYNTNTIQGLFRK